MLRIGMFLAGRYEVLEQIGSGGMSEVYRAKDHKLNRNVAIKVLKQEFSQDAGFVAKFRMEAQSAAGLSHPNIMNVYDVGEENGFYYIVMEYIEGITLKNYISAKGKLEIRESIGIAMQIAQGLEAAHAQHIVHRDIKPQNIMISKEGKVKVTDFGIARAASTQTISSSAMGSVHYISPEQARGGYCDERSDIYSLGITLYEMLTGRVPYDGDSTVAVALQHIQSEMIPPTEYDPMIPVSLEKIIMKCTQKKTDMRYSSATELIDDLRKALMMPNEDFVKEIPLEDDSPTVELTPEEVARLKEEAHRGGPSAPARPAEKAAGTAAAVTAAAAGTGAAAAAARRESDVKEYVPRRSFAMENTGGAPLDRAAGAPAAIVRPVQNESAAPAGESPAQSASVKDTDKAASRKKKTKDDDDAPFKFDRLINIVLIILAVLIVVVGVIVFMKACGVIDFSGGSKETTTTAVPTVIPQTTESEAETTEPASEEESTTEETTAAALIEMKDFRGMTIADAEDLLKEMGLTYAVSAYEPSDYYEKDQIIWQSVDKGEMLEAGTQVLFVVSSGIEQVKIPEKVIGATEETARQLLAEQGFTVADAVTTEFSDTVTKGCVIRTSPDAGTEVDKGSVVSLVISAGPEVLTTVVPSLNGLTLEEATVRLTENKLSLGDVTYENSETVEQGLVIWQSIASTTTVEEYTSVNIVISKGSSKATVPNLLGVEEQLVAEMLTDEGLAVGEFSYTEVDDPAMEGRVVDQSIDPDTAVDPQTPVSVVIGYYVSTEEGQSTSAEDYSGSGGLPQDETSGETGE